MRPRLNSLERPSQGTSAYGLEYDLGCYNIVAVAIQRGGHGEQDLNIFNAQAVRRPTTTIDDRFLMSKGGGPVFHNWSGNCVTLRDWFQLTLKEGLTIFRDQEFTADTYSRPLKRIDDWGALREPRSPRCGAAVCDPSQHVADIELTPPRSTKGCRVLRMLHTLVGPEAPGHGCTSRFDGMGVTVDTCWRSYAGFRRNPTRSRCGSAAQAPAHCPAPALNPDHGELT